MRALILAAMVSLSVLGSAGVARADKCDDASADGSKGKNWHWETIGGKRVQVIDQIITVCGKVPRPSVVYVLQAKTINYEWENLKQDFLPLIIATVKKAPF